MEQSTEEEVIPIDTGMFPSQKFCLPVEIESGVLPSMGRDVSIPEILRLCGEFISPLGGRDKSACKSALQRFSFNPRAPRRARRRGTGCFAPTLRFQSTRPTWDATKPRRHPSRLTLKFQSTWGATTHPPHRNPPGEVSIHAPHVGRD